MQICSTLADNFFPTFTIFFIYENFCLEKTNTPRRRFLFSFLSSAFFFFVLPPSPLKHYIPLSPPCSIPFDHFLISSFITSSHPTSPTLSFPSLKTPSHFSACHLSASPQVRLDSVFICVFRLVIHTKGRFVLPLGAQTGTKGQEGTQRKV